MSQNEESNVLTREELKQITERCDKATPGLWISYIEGRDHTSGSSFIKTGENDTRGEDIELSGATADDQDFIAHARQDIPQLLKEIELLYKVISQLRQTRVEWVEA
jgi:type VI protein secretion system component Hcp